jgi:hypothetical protein
MKNLFVLPFIFIVGIIATSCKKDSSQKNVTPLSGPAIKYGIFTVNLDGIPDTSYDAFAKLSIDTTNKINMLQLGGFFKDSSRVNIVIFQLDSILKNNKVTLTNSVWIDYFNQVSVVEYDAPYASIDSTDTTRSSIEITSYNDSEIIGTFEGKLNKIHIVADSALYNLAPNSLTFTNGKFDLPVIKF